jgi:phosphatidylinositol alpha-1,6-mannosyltransferase
MTPRLLLLTPDFPPAIGGIQLLLQRLVDGLADDFDITVVTRRSPRIDGSTAASSSDRGSRAVRVRSTVATGKLGLVDANVLGLAVALRGAFDIVLSGHITTAPAAACLQRLRRTPFVQYVYADEVPNRPQLARFAMRRAVRTIAISTHTRDLALAAGCPESRVEIVAPGVDIPSSTPAARIVEQATRPTIITVARLEDRYKGHDVMLRALVSVRTRVPDVRWVVVGDGSLRAELEANASRRGLSETVEFAGRVSDEERDRRLATAQVFAMPSRLPPSGTEGGEGFGIVYLEAGLQGLPVIAGAVGGALDAVVHDETGLLVDPTSSEELAAALTDLLLDADRAARLGDAGARRARGFSWERMNSGVQAVLHQALAGAGAV